MRLGIQGRFFVEHRDKTGKLLAGFCFKNGAATVGLNNVLDVYLRNQTQTATWYLGLISAGSFTAVAAGDTMASHSGWIEDQDYSEAVRQTYSPGAAASGLLSNSGSTAVFTSNAGSNQIKGIFLTSVNTKGGTTGTLFATGLFSATVTLANLDTLTTTYEVELLAL